VSSEADILFERRGCAGIVTLNRPKALNAVTLGMVRALAGQLAAWAADPAVARVVVRSASERAFSAGGDVRAMHDLGRAGRVEEALTFWREEYILNAAIKRYPKPYIALIDGIVMGGGAGISIHGSHRVAGDSFLFAMPEGAIGLFPDIGATWFLSRMPGETGLWCALTGGRLGPEDGAAAGLASHRVPSARFDAVLAALCADRPVDETLAAFAVPVQDGPVLRRRDVIDAAFAQGEVEDILAALDRFAAGEGDAAAFARESAAMIRANSPTTMRIALAQIRQGRQLDFESCMRLEYRIVSRVVREHDFYEGVRAMLVDKDKAPRWNPPRLDAIPPSGVSRYFAPLPDGLELPVSAP